jgi:hypothetical protein
LKAEAEVNGQPIEFDFSEVRKQMIDSVKPELRGMVKEYFDKIPKEGMKFDKTKGGKGVVEAYMPADRKAKIVEAFQKAGSGSLREQWTIALPKQRRYEIAAHLRDLIFVTDQIKGKQGDTVNIPYVKDVDFEFVTAGTGALTARTGLVSTLTTTLVEAGAYYDAYYTDIEKIDSNLLDELNSVFAHGAVRAEDEKLVNLLCNGTTSDWGQDAAGSGKVADLMAGQSTGAGFAAASTMAVSWIADSIGKLIAKGKDVNPGELVLVLTGQMYITLLKKLSATTNTATNTAVAYAMPTVWTKGMVESYLGVRIIVSGYEMRMGAVATGVGGGGTSYQVGFLMRPKRCLALAPKREILIETDKQIAARTLRIVGTHTFGAAILDQTEAVPILSGITSTDATHLGVD